jgi:hypothetical protein
VGAQGTATLNFGAFPGGSDASVAVTGQAAILAGSLVEAWLFPTATADHTADEHWVETIKVSAGNVVAGTGFTIYGINTNQITEPLDFLSNTLQKSVGGTGTLIYGQWTIAWVWN